MQGLHSTRHLQHPTQEMAIRVTTLTAAMRELSIADILAARDSNDKEGEEEDDKEEDEEDEEMEEGEIPPPRRLTFWTTGINTNPFTSKWGKTIGRSEKKKVKKKDTLWQLLGKLRVSVPVLSTVGLDPVLRDFLISRLVAEVFKVADTFYVPEGIEVCKLPLDLL